jgi:hypothetical protein
VAPWLVLNGGVGYGLSGMQLGATPRLRLPISDYVGLGLALGLSWGKFERSSPFDDTGKYSGEKTYELWFNVGGCLDFRDNVGFHFRFFLGDEITLINDEDESSFVQPSLGIALGYSFQ